MKPQKEVIPILQVPKPHAKYTLESFYQLKELAKYKVLNQDRNLQFK